MSSQTMLKWDIPVFKWDMVNRDVLNRDGRVLKWDMPMLNRDMVNRDVPNRDRRASNRDGRMLKWDTPPLNRDMPNRDAPTHPARTPTQHITDTTGTDVVVPARAITIGKETDA